MNDIIKILQQNARISNTALGEMLGISAEEAAARFAEAGLKDKQPEACWFLSGNGKEATATLAWRVEHTFLSAVDGIWLQTQ